MPPNIKFTISYAYVTVKVYFIVIFPLISVTQIFLNLYGCREAEKVEKHKTQNNGH